MCACDINQAETQLRIEKSIFRTYIAISVEVWVDAEAEGVVVHFGRAVGVVSCQLDVKEKELVVVGRSHCSKDGGSHQVHPAPYLMSIS